MRPELLREVVAWLDRADRDLLLARRALEGPLPLGEGTAYHSQQAAEKALKAYLTARQQAFPRTHDLLSLVNDCSVSDPDFARFQQSARILTPYATLFRYPGGPIEPPLADARRGLDLAAEVVAFVRQRLSLASP
jgi:HEPN domain-containing protein